MAVKSGLAGMATGERWARGESEQVKASCGAHAGVVGLVRSISVLPIYLITLPSLGTTSFQSQSRQTHLVGGTDTNRLRWVG